METILAVLLAMTIEVSDTRPAAGSAKAHKPSGKSTVSKPIDAIKMRFPLLDETIVCQPMPATSKSSKSQTRGAQGPRPAASAHCVLIRPARPMPKQAGAQRARTPRTARVASATSPKRAAKLSGKKKSAKSADAEKKKWVPERVFVRPSVSIGVGR